MEFLTIVVIIVIKPAVDALAFAIAPAARCVVGVARFRYE
jgi:hypothetical protein